MNKNTIFVLLSCVICGACVYASIPTINQVGPAAMPSEIAPIKAPFYMPSFKRPEFGNRSISIVDFGAKSGGIFNCRASINNAIDACSKAGGGRVVIPVGKWLTGRIELKSNVELHLTKDAVLYFSGQLDDYLPVVYCRHEGVEMYGTGALIYAHNQDNIAITGAGKIVGPPLDAPLRKLKKRQVIEKQIDLNSPVKSRIFDGRNGRLHYLPYMISPLSCQNVFIESISIERSAMWNVVPIYCENVVIRSVKINSRDIPCGDGVNIESSRNVLVEYCVVDTGDDSYCLKAGRNEEGVRAQRPVENVVERYNLSLGGHGGITFGSDTAGMVRNVYVHDCRYENVGAGIRFKTRRPRGGGGENLIFENIGIKAQRIISWEMLGQSIYVGDLAKRMPKRDLTPLTPLYRDITIRNISGVATKAILVAKGIPESPISSVIIENADLTGPKGISFTDAKEIILRDCRIHCDDNMIFDLRNVQNFQTQRCLVTGDHLKRVRVSEDTSKNIDLREIDFTGSSQAITLELIDGAEKSSIQLPIVGEK